ncbi:polysaccharide biosynthesis protein [bacterium]|nr:polysaccharide biosynthesis protein [bacterium]
MRIVDLAMAIAPECRHEVVGIRLGEKLHEVLLTEDESRRALEFDDFYVVRPDNRLHEWDEDFLEGGRPVPQGFHYSSDNNVWWFTDEDYWRLESEVKDEKELHPLREAVC